MIQFQNQMFKTRDIYIPTWGTRLISTVHLSKLLMDEDGSSFVSDEAEWIDEQIFFYVEEKEIELGEKKLRKIILDSL